MSAVREKAAGSATTITEAVLPRIQEPTAVAPRNARELTRLFLKRMSELEEGTPEFAYARNTLIEMNLSLVKFAARRFRNRGSGDTEDIIQVGTIGLIKAIDRFDLSREVEFTSFAIPYISGEIKRFFRDTTWAVHVPRRLQELRTELAKAKEQLASVLDRDPTVAELAELLDLTQDEVIDGLVAANGYTAGSIDLPAPSSDSSSAKSSVSYADSMGACDPDMELFEDLHTLAPLLSQLSERDRHILSMRFVQELTQADIGTALGVSQMQVSRLLTRILGRLRAGMLATS
ncbi:RNA polymerase sigma factor [Streptomyces avidinii]